LKIGPLLLSNYDEFHQNTSIHSGGEGEKTYA